MRQTAYVEWYSQVAKQVQNWDRIINPKAVSHGRRTQVKNWQKRVHGGLMPRAHALYTSRGGLMVLRLWDVCAEVGGP